MIDKNSLLRHGAIFIGISVAFGVLSYFGIPVQVYLWEFLIDVKITIFLMYFLWLAKKKQLLLSMPQLSLLRFNLRSNLLIFFLPLLLYAAPIAAGTVVKAVALQKLDNAPTLILATLFDIPAVYVFSITSIFLEEVIVRGVIVSSLQQKFSVFQTALISSGIWLVYNLSEFAGLSDMHVIAVLALMLYTLSVGFFCAVLSFTKKTIWLGYSLRIGVVTITPIILSSYFVESDSFFTTDSPFFTAEGIIISLLLLCLSFFILWRNAQSRENQAY